MKNIYISLILLTFFSCKQGQEPEIQTVEIKPWFYESIPLSEIASNVDKIVLETNESCLIIGVQNLEITNQYIFINDAGRRVLQFDLSGNFIRQIGNQGRGPGEYSIIRNIATDPNNEILYVAAQREILSFDFNGELVYHIEQESPSEFITIVGDTLWSISTSFGVESGSNYANITNLIKYDLKGNPYDTLIVKSIELSGRVGTIFPQAWYISDLGDMQYLYYPVLFMEPLIRDTLYKVKDNKLIPSLKLNFGVSDRQQLAIKNIFKTSNYLFAEYTYKGNQVVFCQDLNSNKKYNVKEGFVDDFYTKGNVQLRPLDLKNDIMYFVKNAHELTDKIEILSEDSNPVIFVVFLHNQIQKEGKITQ